ncbi:MAG: redoxin domain-containing protein [Sporichthyaceae bacterium]
MNNLRRRALALPALATTGLLVLAGCGSGGADAAAPPPPAIAQDQPPAAPTQDQPPAAAADSPKAVPAQLQFTAAAVDGSTIEGAALASKPTVAWFWTPWCSICRKESGTVSSMASKFGDRINVVGIAGKGSVADMARFVSDTGVGGFRHAVDADGGLWSRFGVIGQPSFAFIGSDGKVEVVPGVLSEADLDKRIEAMTRV